MSRLSPYILLNSPKSKIKSFRASLIIDACILFCLYASELAMAKTILSPKYWLIALSFSFLFSLLAFSNTYQQTHHRQENRTLFLMTKKRMQLSMRIIGSLLASIVLLSVIGLFYPVGRRIGVFLSVAGIVFFTYGAVKHWRHTRLFIDGKT